MSRDVVADITNRHATSGPFLLDTV